MNQSFQDKKNKLRTFKEDLIERNLVKEKEYFNQIEIPDGVFYQCEGCGTNILTDDLKSNLYVCPYCKYHHKLRVGNRLRQMCDLFMELDSDLRLKEYTFPGYEDKLKSYQEKTNLKDAVITGVAKINDVSLALGIMDPSFMMASMGSVVGEKITRITEYAASHKLPLLIFCASGGARMQEGIISLMQMAKTSQAINIFKKTGLFISVLTNPTTGGVSASFASLGDITIAEPNSLIGFAGKRVIENTIKETLPDNFQTSEFLLEKGFVDMIVERAELKNTIYKILKLHNY